jgi:hypothetical protein
MATAAQLKAERIAAQEAANTAGYQASLTAAPRSETSQMALSAVATATGAAVRNKAPLPQEARTGVPTPTSIPKKDMPLSEKEFDATVEAGDKAAREGNALVAQGNTAATAAGTTPVGGNPLGTIRQNPDAFDEMFSILRQYGLESLAETYSQLLAEGLTKEQAINKLKYDKTINPKTNKSYNDAYTIRFAGNAARAAKGLNVYDEATYLDVENQYNDTLTKYGLSNMIKPKASEKQAQFAGYMASDIAPTEFAERIKNVSERVLNMDPAIKAQFQAYYPSLDNKDLVSYFLDPKETLPVLKDKITASEIGAVAGAAGPNQQYGINKDRAMDLAKFGVTREQALAGYQDIAEATPTGTKLSGIYGEEGIQYGQATAEDEYLKQDAQAKIKRNRLASKERANFEGSAGNAPGAYSTSYLKKSSAAGLI